jgi:glycosyltransferase involved in cell wall biosynthesis
MKVAIIHEWLETYAGSERVLEQMIKCFPDADVFAVVDFIKPDERSFLQGRPVQTSFIQTLPFARRHFRAYLPIMPVAIEQFDLTAYDLVLSSSHAVAKGVLTGPYQMHISYVHSPMRYAWDQQSQYLRQAGLRRGLKSIYARWTLHRLRTWDVRTASGVDQFLANSSFIGERIYKVYRRDSVVLHPPVDIDSFCPGEKRGDAYVLAARFVPYKRVDLVVQAFATMPNRRLRVIGAGPDAQRIIEATRGASNIELVPPLTHENLVLALQRARAFVFAGEEDFGITLVEAQACGIPVIAFGRGGATDIVQDGLTGILFSEQTVSSVVDAIDQFETIESELTSDACRANAMRFGVERFRCELLDVVDLAFRAKRRPGSARPESGPNTRARILVGAAVAAGVTDG